MKDLVDTTEMYLRTIYELEEEGIVPLRARIAERLDQSGPTVSQTVGRMERDGYVVVANDRSLKMTELGRANAIAVMRKHRLAEQLLANKIGLDIHKVHHEACRWEHVMSTEVERRLIEVLDEYHRSPFGNPIPGLEELGVTDAQTPEFGERACDLPPGKPWRCTIVQLNEIFQFHDDQLRKLTNAGIGIGSEVVIEVDGEQVIVRNGDHEVHVDDDLCHAIRIHRL
ncbi:iron dependent repressor, metal binding and dimerization domain protein [Corynebacterium choanae]|uniref:Diphtheria toxin repressor n=1 Tax=Corynebacterium choanae TaxID=1862358 RepID=A0A3G6J7J5_9CORY|nr:metal-dependent transcriptional regulator [Corynebacterium choanae]AZA13743.1 Diphtheria toxin repressor [Corynebacterium choanae]